MEIIIPVIKYDIIFGGVVVTGGVDVVRNSFGINGALSFRIAINNHNISKAF